MAKPWLFCQILVPWTKLRSYSADSTWQLNMWFSNFSTDI